MSKERINPAIQNFAYNNLNQEEFDWLVQQAERLEEVRKGLEEFSRKERYITSNNFLKFIKETHGFIANILAIINKGVEDE